MFVKVYPEQLKENWALIREAYIASVPGWDEASVSMLILDLLAMKTVCWFVTEEDVIRAVFITQLNDDITRGKKTITIIAAYALEKTTEETFINGFNQMKDYAKKIGVTSFDFFTSNEKIISYARMFNPDVEQSYFQINLEV